MKYEKPELKSLNLKNPEPKSPNDEKIETAGGDVCTEGGNAGTCNIGYDDGHLTGG